MNELGYTIPSYVHNLSAALHLHIYELLIDKIKLHLIALFIHDINLSCTNHEPVMYSSSHSTMHATHLPLLPPTVSPLRRHDGARLASSGRQHGRHDHRPGLTVRATLRSRERDPKKRVVVTGMGLVSVFGNDVDVFYDSLLAGKSGVNLINSFDVSDFSTRFAAYIPSFSSDGYIDGKDERRMDEYVKYCVVSGKKAIHNAGLTSLTKIDKSRAGVLVGSSVGGSGVFVKSVHTLQEEGNRRLSPFFVTNFPSSSASAKLAIDIGFQGPIYSIITACASSNYCIQAAANHIRKGVADLMVAGGSEATNSPIALGGFCVLRALSKRNDDPAGASRPWSKDRDGFVLGEGAGLLVLESLEHAMRRDAPIIGEYLGGAITFDAHHMTDPRPDGLGVSLCIQKGLDDAGVAPEEVNYINAHGTSTMAGDLAEVNAMKKVFKNLEKIKVNSTKSLIGHSLGAAAGLEAVAVLKAISTGWLHPTINQFDLEPEVNFDTVPNVKQQCEVNVAISNSFGFGGHNSTIVFAAFKP